MGIILITLVHLRSFKAIEDAQDSWTKYLRCVCLCMCVFTLMNIEINFSKEGTRSGLDNLGQGQDMRWAQGAEDRESDQDQEED